MKITIETTTRAQANYILSHVAKKTGAMCEGGHAASDSVITVTREEDNTVTVLSNYYNTPIEVADSGRLPQKWNKWIKENN